MFWTFFSPENDEMSVDRQLVDDCSVLGVNLTPEWDDEEESERQIEAKSDDVSISSDIPIERYNDSSLFLICLLSR